MATQTLTDLDFKTKATQSGPLPANGPAAAALVAAGIGCAGVGIATALVEASKFFENALNFYKPVGPLSGKTLVGVVAFFVSWIILGFRFQDKEVRIARWATVAFILIALGFLLTFPPVFDVFADVFKKG
jgi:hypothetical protein